MRNFRKVLYVLITCFISGYGAYFAYTAFYDGTLFNVIAGLLISAVGIVGLYGTFRGKTQDNNEGRG
ncbi:hypothetical protein SAMN05444141_103764 [Pseudovibrio denitrificans]|uniref:Uncharacterized protein n=1 Tax=Pseudovibrio denitrificans TaxID=258256 RepID=A0A1I7B8M5_9HYPH|nr:MULTISPECIES: hypothetical protein [Pseudovibrio]EEA95015.1 hypothetical protein PJE062_2583 [Pseudovibrio sp. JE062]SFT83533.1 hypothetical protein SAMN05444141_103764 [Pseudovibrio denitrificans]